MYLRPHVGSLWKGHRRGSLLDPFEPFSERLKNFTGISSPNLAGVSQLPGRRIVADQKGAKSNPRTLGLR